MSDPEENENTTGSNLTDEEETALALLQKLEDLGLAKEGGTERARERFEELASTEGEGE